MKARVAPVIAALVLVVGAVGVLAGRDLERSGQRAVPTTSTGPNYGKVSCAAGGCEVWGPCPNGVPPVSHWSCTEAITQQEFDAHIRPQLNAEARRNAETAIRSWVEQNGGPLDPSVAEDYCSSAFGLEDPAMSVA